MTEEKNMCMQESIDHVHASGIWYLFSYLFQYHSMETKVVQNLEWDETSGKKITLRERVET